MQSQHGLTVHFACEEDGTALPAGTKTFLYKATREILFNVVKHAGVREADLKLSREGDLLTLTVQDHGLGFDLQEGMPRSTAGGMGLYRISEQVEALGGSMELVSFPDDGCQVRLLMPIEERG
jgi:signal transduction histidine kinase